MNNHRNDQCFTSHLPDTDGQLRTIQTSDVDVAQCSPYVEGGTEPIEHPELLEDFRLRFGISYLELYAEGITQEKLAKDLQHTDWHMRLLAMGALESLQDDIPLQFIPLIIQNLSHPSDAVRGAAAQLLANLEEQAPKTYLLLAIGDRSGFVRASIIQALSTLGSKLPLETIMRACLDEEAIVRTAAVQALRYSEGKVPIELFIQMLQDEDFLVRLATVETLRELGDLVPVEVLLTAVGDEDEDVRMAVIQSLGERIGQFSIYTLLTGLQDSDDEIRLALIQLLHQIDGPIPLEPLILALRDSTKEVQNELLRLLAKHDTALLEQMSHTFLCKSLKDSNHHIRKIAAWAAGEKKDSTMLTLLRSLAHDEYDDVQEVAKWALENINSRDYYPYKEQDTHAQILEHVPSHSQIRTVLTYFQDKKGFVNPLTLDTSDEQVLVFVCGYQRHGGLFHDQVLQQLLPKHTPIQHFRQALHTPDEAIRKAAIQAKQTLHDRPWEEIFIISLCAPCNLNPLDNNEKPTRIVLCTVSYHNVRDTDGPLLPQLANAYCQAINKVTTTTKQEISTIQHKKASISMFQQWCNQLIPFLSTFYEKGQTRLMA